MTSQALVDAFTNAILADSSYVGGMSPGGNLRGLLSDRMTVALAGHIDEKFSVVKQVEAGLSSFDATVWRQNHPDGTPNELGVLYISMRGTLQPTDFVVDIDLAVSGNARAQLTDMVNWWLRVTTPVGKQAVQVASAASVYVLAPSMPGEGLIASTDLARGIEVNGHSLGGYLASAFTRLFGVQANVQHTTTFNSAGFAPGSDAAFTQLQNLIGPHLGLGRYPDVSEQTNYFAKNGLNVTTNSFYFGQQGRRAEIFNEYDTSQVGNHYMYKLTDVLALGAVLQKLDPNLDLVKLNALLEAGSNITAASIEGIFDGVRRALAGPGITPLSIGDAGDSAPTRVGYHAALDKFQKDHADLAGQLNIKLSSLDLRAQARNDFAALVALQDLSPIVVSGKDAEADAQLTTLWQTTRPMEFAAWQADKSTPTPTTFTDSWIADRATLLTAVIAHNVKDGSGVAYTAALPIDRRYDLHWIDGDGTERILFGENTARQGGVLGRVPSQRLFFGAAGADEIAGTSNILGDRLYGAAGNDTVSGLGGNDYAEGGSGDDRLDGGAGNDTLFGGVGADAYVFDGAWGKDIITDADGQGLVLLGNAKLSHGELMGNVNTWQEQIFGGPIVQYEYRDSARQLVVTRQGDSTSSITINNFDIAAAKSDQGYLGIRLDTTGKAALIQASAGKNVWNKPGFSTASLAGGTSKVTAGKTFTIYLNKALDAGQSLILRVQGAVKGTLKAVLGDEVVDADGAVLSVAAGQTEVTFALYAEGDDAAQSGSVSVEWREDDETISTSNTWALDVDASSQTTRTFMGDFTKKIEDGKYKFTTDFPVGGVPNYGVELANPASPGAADAIMGTAQPDKMIGLGGNDALFGRDGNDVIDGGEGDDVLQGGLGADTVSGGAGDDIIYGSSTGFLWTPDIPGRENLAVPAGQTLLTRGFGWVVTTDGSLGLNGQPVRILSSQVVRDLQVADVGNIINAGAGDDIVHAGVANDRVEAGSGSDIVNGMGGDDLLLGQSGADYLLGDGESTGAGLIVSYTPGAQHGQDFLDGGEGDDTLVGQGNSDVLYGGQDNDTLWGDGGQFVSGSDLYLDPGYHADDYLDGEDGDDTLVGQGGADTLFGGLGNDMLQGDDHSASRLPGKYHGNDDLDGEEGEDTLIGGGAADTLYGGADDDLIHGDDSKLDAKFHGADYIDGQDGDDTMVGGGGADTIFGGAGDDKILGDGHGATGVFEGDDYIDGEDGNDTIDGGGGDDTLYGGADDDELSGGAGNDYVDGGDGNDTLRASLGFDILVGGAGSNLFVVEAGAGNTEIRSSSQTDRIVLGEGVTLASITGHGDGAGMALEIGASQTLVIDGSVAAFQFTDGTVIDLATMTAHVQAHPPAPPTPTGAPGETRTETTNLTDADGNPAGSSVVVVTPTGSTTTIYAGADGTGAKQSETWVTAEGGKGRDTFGADGSSSGIAHNVDGSWLTYTDDGRGERVEESFSADGVKTLVVWTHADGSRGREQFFPDGSSTGMTHHADGSYETRVSDGKGGLTTLSFDAGGKLLGTALDGSTYPATKETRYADGGWRVDVWNAPDDFTSTLYAADGRKASASWAKDGGHGVESFGADGYSSSTTWHVDGSYETNEENGHGEVRTAHFSASGGVLGSSVQQTNGLNKITTFYAADGQWLRQDWSHPGGESGTAAHLVDITGNLNLLDVLVGRDLPVYQGWYGDDAGVRTDNHYTIGVSWYTGWGSADSSRPLRTGEFNTQEDGAIYNAWWKLNAYQGGSNSKPTYSVTADWYAPGHSGHPDTNDAATYFIWDYYLGTKIEFVLNKGGNIELSLEGIGTPFYSSAVSLGNVSSRNSYSIPAFNGSGNFSLLEYDGAGNTRLTTYTEAKVRIADLWSHNDGSHGTNVYLADGSVSGVSANPEGSYVEFVRAADGVVTSSNYPDATGRTKTLAYTPPPVLLEHSSGSGQALQAGVVPAGGTAQYSSRTYTSDDWLFEVSHTPAESPCDQVRTVYDNDGTVLSTVTLHTDPGYEVSVNVGGTRVGTQHDVQGRATGRFTDDGQGTVTTVQIDEQGRLSERKIAVTSADGSETISWYAASGALLRYDVQGVGLTRVEHYDGAGRFTGHDESIADADGNAMVTRHAADGSLLGYTATVVAADGLHITATTYDAAQIVTGVNVTTIGAGGALQTDAYDAQGRLTGSVIATPGTAGDIDLVNYDAAGGIVNYVTLRTDSQRAIVLTTYDSQGRKLREDRHHADGTQTITEFAADGSTSTTAWGAEDGWRVDALDAAGNSSITRFSGNGVKLSRSWRRTDGSHGEDIYGADGSATGTANYPDGSTATFATESTGKQIATYRDAAGQVTARATTFELMDRSETVRYDAAGALLTERWWGTDGSWGFTDWTGEDAVTSEQHAADGSYSTRVDDRRGNISTTEYDAQSRKTSRSWVEMDGGSGSESFNVDGNVISLTIKDQEGTTRTTLFDNAGMRISQTWQAVDGSYGSEDYLTRTSEAHFPDGSYSHTKHYTNGNGHTELFDSTGRRIRIDQWFWDGSSSWEETTYDAAGAITRVSYGSSEGWWGFDAYNADGTIFGEYHEPGGYWKKWTGDANSTIWQESTGDHGRRTRTDTSNYSETFFADGTSEIDESPDDRGFYRLTYFDSDGHKVKTTWNKDGVFGEDIFNADGSSTGTTRNTNDGTSTSYIDNGAGDITTTHYDASGAATGNSWVLADGSHGTTTFNVDGTISGTRVNADGSVVTFSNEQPGSIVMASEILDQGARENVVWSYTVPAGTFFQAGLGGVLVYTAMLSDGGALPSWISFDTLTRTFSGTPPDGSPPEVSLKVIASDGSGRSESDNFILSIADYNKAPVASQAITDQRVVEDRTWTFVVPAGAFTDADPADTLTYAARLADGSLLPSWLAFDATTRTFSGTPGNSAIGSTNVRVTATDKAGESASMSFTVTVVESEGDETVARLIGTAGNDKLVGGPNSDAIDGGAGNDTLIGHAGDDTYYVDSLADKVVERSGEGFDTVVASTVTYTLPSNLEKLVLGGVTAAGYGNRLANTLVGNAADNVLFGKSGDDTIEGRGGNDMLDGGRGSDALLGGLGDDTYIQVDNDLIVEQAGEGRDTVMASASYALGDHLEVLVLTRGGLVGTGNELDNRLEGTRRADTLQGGAGNDDLVGAGGSDTLEGGSGDDTYFLARSGRATVRLDQSSASESDVDTAHFAPDIAFDQLWFQFTGAERDDLKITILGTRTEIVVEDWLAGDSSHIDQFKSGDGKTLLDSQVQALASAMAGFAVPSTTVLPPNYQSALTPVLAAAWQ